MFAGDDESQSSMGRPSPLGGVAINEEQVAAFLQEDEALKNYMKSRRERMERLEKERLAALPPLVISPTILPQPALKPWERPKVYGPGQPYPGQPSSVVEQPKPDLDSRWDEVEKRNHQELTRNLDD